MDAIIGRIKGYVQQIYPTIETDLLMPDALLNLVIQDVVDRALAYMNRQQFVQKYEYQIANENPCATEDALIYEPWELNNLGWPIEDVVVPIPQEIERALAKTVVETARTLINGNTDAAIKAASDNGQSITYDGVITAFFNSADDAKIFSSILVLLDAYLVPTITKNESTAWLQRYNAEHIL